MTYEEALEAMGAAHAAGNFDEAKRLALLAKQISLEPPPPPTPQPAPVQAAGFNPLDTAISFGQGVTGGIKSILESAGAHNAPAAALGEFNKTLGDYYSPERKAEQQRRQALQKEADKSDDWYKEAATGVGGVTEAPVQSLAQGLGSAAPTILLGLGATALGATLGAPLALAGAVGLGIKFAVGALQGAGEVKGSIYETVERALRAKGMDKEEAAAQAEAAQDYLGDNWGTISAAAGIGAVAAGTGTEKELTKLFTKPVVKKVGEEAAEGVAKRIAKNTGTEFLTEGLQGGQERYATNTALTGVGEETPAFQGVVGAGARDALVGAITGAAVSGVTAQRDARVEQQQIEDAQKQREIEAQKTAARDLQQQQYAAIDARLAKEAEAAQAAKDAAAAAAPTPPLTPRQAAELRTQLTEQMETAQEGLNQATAAARAAARSGDEAAHTAAQEAIAEHKATIAKLAEAMPPPLEALKLETNPSLAALQRKLNGRLKAYDGAVDDPAAANSIFAEIRELQAKIAATQENKTELSTRQDDLKQQRTDTSTTEDATARMQAEQEALTRQSKPPTDLLPVEEQSQGTLFSAPASAGGNSQIVSNVGEAPSRAKLMADAAIARATGNFSKAEEIKQQISDISNRERERTQESSDVDRATVNRLTGAMGIELPKTATDLSKHSDAIDSAYAKMVTLLGKSNRGRLDAEDLYAARDTVVERMIADVASRQGGITPAQRSDIRNQTNELLRELTMRFGDTRNIVRDGMRAIDVQNADGTYKTDLLEDGQFGRINEESAVPGRQTFGSPYAAVEAIRGQLTDIRNNMLKGPEPAAPKTPAEVRAVELGARTDRLPDEGPIRAIRDNMDIISANPEYSRIVHDWLDAKDVPNNSNALDHPGESIPRGTVVKGNVADSVGYAKQRLNDMLLTLEQGKRSETEGTARAQQGDLLDGVPMKGQTVTNKNGISGEVATEVLPAARGKVFDTPEALVTHLQSSDLQGLRERLGLQIPTVQRMATLMEPLRQKLSGLHSALEQLSLQSDSITDLPQRKTRMHEQMMSLQQEATKHMEALLAHETLIDDATRMSTEASQAIAENDPAARLRPSVQAANQAVVSAKAALEEARNQYLSANQGMPETSKQKKARDLAVTAKENWQNAENEANRLSYPTEELQRGENETAPAFQKRVNEKRAIYDKAKAHAEFLKKHYARMQGQYTRTLNDFEHSTESANRWQLSHLALKDATAAVQRALRKQAIEHAKTPDSSMSDAAINEWVAKDSKLQAVLSNAIEARAKAEEQRARVQQSIDAIRKQQSEIAAGEKDRGTTPVDVENARRATDRATIEFEANDKRNEIVATKKELGALEQQNTPQARAAEAAQRAEQQKQPLTSEEKRSVERNKQELIDAAAARESARVARDTARDVQADAQDAVNTAPPAIKAQAEATLRTAKDATMKAALAFDAANERHRSALERVPERMPVADEGVKVREEQDRAQRKDENDMVERLSKLSGEEINHEAFREAQALVGTPAEYAATVSKLEARKNEPGVSDDTKNKIDRALAKLARDKKYLDGASEGNQGARLAAETELARLTEPFTTQRGKQRQGRVDEIKQRLAEAEANGATKKQLSNIRKELTQANTRVKELKAILKGFSARADRTSTAEKQARQEAAKKFLLEQTKDTFEERGTLQGDAPVRGPDGKIIDQGTWQEGARPALRPGRVSRASKREVLAGDPRTGTEESRGLRDPVTGERGAGENKVSNQNPVQESRKIVEPNRPMTKQEMLDANADAASIVPGRENAAQPASDPAAHKLTADKAVALQNEEVEAIERRLNEARARVDEAEDAATPLPYEKMTALLERQKYLENKLAHAKEMRELALSRQRIADREVNPPTKVKATEPQASKEDAEAALDAAYDKEIESYDSVPDDAFVGEQEASDIDIGVVFRTSEAGKRGMPIEDVQTAVAEELAKMPNAPEVKYVQSETDLPLRLQGYITKVGKNGNVPGMFDKKSGKVWLIGDNVKSSQDAVLTVLHEVAGHYGLTGMLGSAYESTMNRLYNGHEGLRAQADAKMKANNTLTKEVAIEEVLAEMAETQPNSSIVQRAIYAIKTWANRIFGYKGVSDADVRQIVANARRYAETGTRGPEGGKAVTDKNGTPVLRSTSMHEGTGVTKLIRDEKDDDRSMKERYLDGTALALENAIADMHAYAVEATRIVGGHKGKQAEMAIRATGSTNTLVAEVMHGGSIELRTDSKGFYEFVSTGKNSGKETFNAISKIPAKNAEAKSNLFTEYMASLRGTRLGANKVGAGVSAEGIRKFLQDVEANPALKAALEAARTQYNKGNTDLVNTVVESGAITEEEGKAMLEHGDYIPLYREHNGKLQAVLSDNQYVNMGDIAHTPFLHALKGGKERILPIHETFFMNTKLMLDIAHINVAKRNMAYVLREAGKPSKKMFLHDGKGPAGSDILTWREAPTAENETGHRHLKIDTEDTVLAGIPSTVLAQSIEGFHATLPASLKWAQYANEYLRAGITRLPMHTIRQLLKDPISADAVTKMAGNPLTAVLRTFKGYAKGMLGDNAALKEVQKRGLVNNNMMIGESHDMDALAKQMMGGDAPGAIRKILNFMDKSAHMADAATRSQIYAAYIKKGYSTAEAAHATRESMNFQKRGASATIQQANRTLIFFNSAIQGLNVAQNAVRGRSTFEKEMHIKQHFLNSAAMLFVAGAAYAAVLDKNEKYRRLKPADKLGYLHILTPTGELMRIPIGYFEAGGAAWAAGQAAIMYGGGSARGKEIVKGMGKYALTAIPGGGGVPMMPGLKQIAEWGLNKDFRTWNDIVPSGLARKTADQQFNDKTPSLLRDIGEYTGVSPMQMQHALMTVFGGGIDAGLQLYDLVKPSSDVAKPTPLVERTPFISGLFQNPDSDAAAEVVYDIAGKARAAGDTYNGMLNEGRSRGAITAYRDKHLADIRMAPVAAAFMETMSELNVAIKQITNSSRTAEEKRARIDTLKARQRAVSERFMTRMQQMQQRFEQTATA